MLPRTSKFLRLPRDDQWILVVAAVSVTTVEVALRLSSLRRVQSVCRWIARRSGDNASHDRDQVAWAVHHAGNVLPPEDNCLATSLVAWTLLRHSGHDSEIKVGVRRDEGEELDAHSWVVDDEGVVVGGGRGLSEYSTFPEFWIDDRSGGREGPATD